MDAVGDCKSGGGLVSQLHQLPDIPMLLDNMLETPSNIRHCFAFVGQVMFIINMARAAAHACPSLILNAMICVGPDVGVAESEIGH